MKKNTDVHALLVESMQTFIADKCGDKSENCKRTSRYVMQLVMDYADDLGEECLKDVMKECIEDVHKHDLLNDELVSNALFEWQEMLTQNRR